jgi:hypothetical protein
MLGRRKKLKHPAFFSFFFVIACLQGGYMWRKVE